MSGDLVSRFPLQKEMPAVPGVVLLGDNGSEIGDVPVDHFVLKTEKQALFDEAEQLAEVAANVAIQPSLETAAKYVALTEIAVTAAAEAVDNAAKPVRLLSEAQADVAAQSVGFRWEVYADPQAPALRNPDGSNNNGYYRKSENNTLVFYAESINSISTRSRENPAFRTEIENTDVSHFFTKNKKYVIGKLFAGGWELLASRMEALSGNRIRFRHKSNAKGMVIDHDGIISEGKLGFGDGTALREKTEVVSRMAYTLAQVTRGKQALWGLGPRAAAFAGLKMRWNLDNTYDWSDKFGSLFRVNNQGVFTHRNQVATNGEPRQGNPIIIIKGLRNRLLCLVLDPNGYVKKKGAPNLVVTGVPYNHYSKFGTLLGNGSDESVALKALHDAAKNAGIRKVLFDNINVNAPGATDIHQVMFEGEGKLTNNFRKYIIPTSAPTKVAFGKINPNYHLPSKKPGDTCVVVFTGDSTYQATNTIDDSQSPRVMIEREMQRQNPGVKFTFWNRAISSQRWDTLDAVSGTTPPWYSPSTRAWLDFIRDLAPDVVIIGFGMNDRAGLKPSTIYSVRDKMAAWPKVSKIIIGTCMTPTRNTVDYETAAEVEQRMYAAGIERTIANAEGWGVLDFNEHLCATRDGFGLISQPLVSRVYQQTGQLPYTFADNCEEYAGHFYFATNPLAGGAVLAFSLSSVAANQMMFRRGSTGLLEYRIVTDATSVQTEWTASTMRADYTDLRLHLHVDNEGWLQVLTNAYSNAPADSIARMDHVFRGYVKRFGGLFKPRVGLYDATTGAVDNTVVPCQLWQIAIGQPRLYRQEMTNLEMYDINGALTNNGNGINHQTAVGAQVNYAPVIRASNFNMNF